MYVDKQEALLSTKWPKHLLSCVLFVCFINGLNVVISVTVPLIDCWFLKGGAG